MARKKKAKKEDFSKSLFAKAGSKENFWTLTGRMGSLFGGRDKSRDKLNISGAGLPDRDAPQIGGGGVVKGKAPDISGRQRDQRAGRVPDIGGAGSVRSTIADIGGGGDTNTKTPSLGGPPKVGRRKPKGKVPSIGALGKTSDKVPSLGGVKEAGVPDIGAAGPGKTGKGAKRVERGILRLSTVVGGFRALSDDEETEFNLFIRRSMAAGLDVGNRNIHGWKARVMLQQMTVDDLWKTDAGQDIERRYGRKGEYLDLPEAERPKIVVPEVEETKEAGVRPSARAVGKDIAGRIFNRSNFRR